MKHLTTLKDNKWVWPISDENSWKYQNEFYQLSEKLLPHVRNKKIMVQAGGNCGYLLNTFVNHFEVVYTFEPDPINFYCLNQNVSSPNVIKIQSCLGENAHTVSTQQLIRSDRPNDTGGVHVSGSGYTPTIVLDNLNLVGCDLIQLDVEGYELKALKGSVETIKKYKPVLCIEFCEKWLNRYENCSDQILKFVHDLGYIQVDQYGVDKIFIQK